MAGPYNKNRGRESKREQAQRRNAAFAFYGMPQRVVVPKERAARKPSGKRLEKHVLADIIRVLRVDPRVAKVERNQSGVFKDGNRTIKVGSRGKLDLTVYLVGGRFAEIEVKRPGGRPDERQAARIASIRASGGIAGFATSAESALALLP